MSSSSIPKRRRISSTNDAAESASSTGPLTVRNYEPKPSSSSASKAAPSKSSASHNQAAAAAAAATPAKPMSAIEVRRAKRLAQEQKVQEAKAEKQAAKSGSALLVKPFRPPPAPQSQSNLAANGKRSRSPPASSSSESVSDSSSADDEDPLETTDSGSALPDNLFELNQAQAIQEQTQGKGKQKQQQQQQERKGPQRYFSGEATGGHTTEHSGSEEASLPAAAPLSIEPPHDVIEPSTSSTATFTPQPGTNTTRVHFRSAQQASAYASSSAASSASMDSSSEGILLALRSTDAVAVTGTASMRVLSGSVLFQQALFTPSSAPVDIIAPSTHVLPMLEVAPLSKTEAEEGNLTNLYKAAKLSPAIEDPFFEDFDAVVLFLPSTGSGIRGIDQVARLAGIISRSSSLWSAPPAAQHGSTFALVGDAAEGSACAPLAADWETALQSLEQAVRSGSGNMSVTALGPKRSGKSTLCRYAVNRLLQSVPKVAWLDLDLGQAEFTPSGLLSLHILDQPLVNPNFTHQRSPFRAHFVGDTQPTQSFDYILAAVQELVQTYQHLVREQEQPLPLVVNTFGTAKGLVGDLLSALLTQAVQPTHLMRFRNAPAEVSFVLPQAETLNVSALPDSSTRAINAYDHRSMAMLSCFYQDCMDGPVRTWDFTKALVERDAFSVNWSEGALKQVYISSSSVDYAHALLALNASVVGLVASDSPNTDTLRSRTGKLPYDQLTPYPDPTQSRCLGLGIITSVDPTAHTFQLATPIDPEALAECNAMVRGSLELPLVFMLHGGTSAGLFDTAWDKVPYLASTITGPSNGGQGPSSAASTTAALPGDGRRRVRKNAARGGQSKTGT